MTDNETTPEQLAAANTEKAYETADLFSHMCRWANLDPLAGMPALAILLTNVAKSYGTSKDDILALVDKLYDDTPATSEEKEAAH